MTSIKVYFLHVLQFSWILLSDQTYTLDKLEPLQTYIFRFAARSEVGEGEWSGEKVSFHFTLKLVEALNIFNETKTLFYIYKAFKTHCKILFSF